MAMEGLGRLFDVVPIATTTKISLKYVQGITFICTGNDTFTLNTMNTYNGSGETLATITDYYTNASTAGADQWVAASQAAADNVVISSGAVAFYVDAGDLPDGYNWVEITKGSSGVVTAIYHDLYQQEAPPYMPVRSGATS